MVVVLPLGTLAAQRIANPSAFSCADDTKPPSSGGSNKEPFLKSWHSATVSSRVESVGQDGGRYGNGFAKYEGADAEKGVRVARQIEHHEEMHL